MSDSIELMPGQSPPFAIVTSTDQRGVLWIVTAFCLATAITSLIIRAYVRVEFSQSYGKDDIFISGSFATFIVQSSLVFYEVQKGMGRSLTDVDHDSLISLEKASYVSDLFYIVTLWATKCSVTLLLARLTASQTKNELVTKIVLAATAVLGLVSFLIAALDCDLRSPWKMIGTHCAGRNARWKTIAAFDIATELAIFANLFFIMWGVQLRRSKKATVIIGFALRLVIIPPIALRLHYVLSAYNSSNTTLKLSDAVILTQVELVVAIVSATVPCLRPFMAATYTTWGGRLDTVSGSGYQARAYADGKGGSANVSKSTGSRAIRSIFSKSATDTMKSQDDIALNPINYRGKKNGSGWEELGNSQAYPPGAPKDGQHKYMATTRAKPVAEDQQSDDSQKMIIRRDLEWTVHHEPRASMPEGHHQTQEESDGRFLHGV